MATRKKKSIKETKPKNIFENIHRIDFRITLSSCFPGFEVGDVLNALPLMAIGKGGSEYQPYLEEKNPQYVFAIVPASPTGGTVTLLLKLNVSDKVYEYVEEVTNDEALRFCINIHSPLWLEDLSFNIKNINKFIETNWNLGENIYSETLSGINQKLSKYGYTIIKQSEAPIKLKFCEEISKQ